MCVFKISDVQIFFRIKWTTKPRLCLYIANRFYIKTLETQKCSQNIQNFIQRKFGLKILFPSFRSFSFSFLIKRNNLIMVAYWIIDFFLVHFQIVIFSNIVIAIINFSLSLTIQLSLLLFTIAFEGEKDRQLMLLDSWI